MFVVLLKRQYFFSFLLEIFFKSCFILKISYKQKTDIYNSVNGYESSTLYEKGRGRRLVDNLVYKIMPCNEKMFFTIHVVTMHSKTD